MKNQLLKILSLSIVIFITSCNHQRGWVYKTNDYSSSSLDSKFKTNTVNVQEFLDNRPAENKNYTLLYLIPLVPYSTTDLNSPETISYHLNSGLWINFDPRNDFARALTAELNEAKIFGDSLLSNSKRDSDYFIKGEILLMNYKGKLYSYGFGPYVTIPWLLGLPATTVSNDLEIKLSLINSKTKKVLFTKNYKATPYKKTSNAYNMANDFYYPEMLREINKEFISDITKL